MTILYWRIINRYFVLKISQRIFYIEDSSILVGTNLKKSVNINRVPLKQKLGKAVYTPPRWTSYLQTLVNHSFFFGAPTHTGKTGLVKPRLTSRKPHLVVGVGWLIINRLFFGSFPPSQWLFYIEWSTNIFSWLFINDCFILKIHQWLFYIEELPLVFCAKD
jgi:hypothetical protein